MEDQVKIWVVVEVRDINDNAPYFQEGELEIKMSENAAKGMRFPLPARLGSGYREELPKDTISAVILTSPLTCKAEQMVISTGIGAGARLDREEKAIHHLVLTASDGGDPVRTSTARIRVMVLDANDNAPAFAQSGVPCERSGECGRGH